MAATGGGLGVVNVGPLNGDGAGLIDRDVVLRARDVVRVEHGPGRRPLRQNTVEQLVLARRDCAVLHRVVRAVDLDAVGAIGGVAGGGDGAVLQGEVVRVDDHGAAVVQAGDGLPVEARAVGRGTSRVQARQCPTSTCIACVAGVDLGAVR